MKQFFLLLTLTIAGGIAAPYQPFWGLLLYYGLAVLRPQYMWEWALPVEWRWSLFAAAIVVFSVLVNLHRVVIRGRITTITMLMLGYGVTLLISCVAADNPAVAIRWGEEHAKILFIAIIATFFIDRVWHVRWMAAMIFAMLGYIAWEINFLYLINNRLDVYHHGYGGLDNNGAGLLIAMGIPLAYAFGVGATKRWQRAAAWGAALIMLHAVMMTYSRGAMVATLVGTVWLFLHHRNRKQTVVIAVAACLAVSVLAGQEIRERFFSTTRYQEDSSAMSRLDSWEAAWVLAWENPLTGHGLRNANIYSANYGADRQGRTIHSVYLQIAADSGIPSMLIYMTLLALTLITFGRCRRICREFLNEPDASRAPPAERDQVAQLELIALGLQGSLIIFAFGGIFLSVEVFELPWLLIVLGAVLPTTLREHLTALTEQEEKAPIERKRKHRRVSRTNRAAPAMGGIDDLLHNRKGWVHP